MVPREKSLVPRGVIILYHDVLGCLVRYNSTLMHDTPVPYSFECTVNVDDVEEYDDIRMVAEETTTFLADTLGAELVIGIDSVHWEYIGRRFNLYAYPLRAGDETVGELRVVESGGYVVNVSGALGADISTKISSGVAEKLKADKLVKKGNTIDMVLLEPPGSRAAPGQVTLPRFIVYAVEGIPGVSISDWRLRIGGEVSSPKTLSYEELVRRSRLLSEYEFHCVTGWSTGKHQWRGVLLRELLEEAEAAGSAKWLAARNPWGYASIVPLGTAIEEGAVITHIDGRSLAKEHGFPARLFFPSLYGWKAAKWITEIILLREYEDGFWESLAYHERGLVSAEERFKIRNPLIASAKKLIGEPRRLPPGGRVKQ